jgi:RNase adaptor protein for sRNA GlmZ degradation
LLKYKRKPADLLKQQYSKKQNRIDTVCFKFSNLHNRFTKNTVCLSHQEVILTIFSFSYKTNSIHKSLFMFRVSMKYQFKKLKMKPQMSPKSKIFVHFKNRSRHCHTKCSNLHRCKPDNRIFQ